MSSPSQFMRVALVHDYLNQYGGAERVLQALLDLFPDADLFTLLYSRERTLGHFDGSIRKTSFLDYPLARRYHRPFIPLMPAATRSLDLGDQYDIIISDTAGYAKGVRHSKRAFHICYCYTPLRYAWETDTYFSSPLIKTVFRQAFRYLERWDFEAAQKPDVILAVSQHIANKIQRYYHRQAKVVYPPVDYTNFYYDRALVSERTEGSYYLAVGRLLPYKKFDLLINAFSELSANLKIVGTGPERKRIQHQISRCPNIEYTSFVTDDELRGLYRGASAFLFPQVEDFGLVAAEALACGTPVIAMASGGALEIVQHEVTGIFFERQSVSSIREALDRFETLSWDREKISRLSQRFSAKKFKEQILSSIPSKSSLPRH